MSTFAERQPGLYPTALAGRWGRRWGAAFGAQKDAVVTAAKDAVKSGFVRLAPADALPRHAADAALPLLPGESDAALRLRIAGAWDFWPAAGTLAGLETAADLLGYVDRAIHTARDLSRDPWAQWFLFTTDHSIALRAWGAPATWGTGVWGSDASRDYARRVRGLLRLVSNARDRGWVVLSLNTPGWWGSGTWSAGSASWGGKNIRWKV